MENANPHDLFDTTKRMRRLERARRRAREDANFLSDIAATTLSERLQAVNRGFEFAIDYESLFDNMSDALGKLDQVETQKRIGGLSLKSDPAKGAAEDFKHLAMNSCDLVTSVFGLHWHNNLPASLAEIANKLRPDGLFLAALPGDRTLSELRDVLITIESQTTDNVSLRVDPFGEVRQYGALLQRAGFALPVVDSEIFTVRYGSIQKMVGDLRNWGGTSALKATSLPLNKNQLEMAEQLYRKRYSDPDGRLRVTYETVFLHGWKPHESQQKPLSPGTGEIPLGKILGKKTD